MMKVKDYRIVVQASIKELEDAVRRLIAEGWQPLGGAFKTGVDWGIAQTMVK